MGIVDICSLMGIMPKLWSDELFQSNGPLLKLKHLQGENARKYVGQETMGESLRGVLVPDRFYIVVWIGL